jgi:hypothetical protein
MTILDVKALRGVEWSRSIFPWCSAYYRRVSGGVDKRNQTKRGERDGIKVSGVSQPTDPEYDPRYKRFERL